MFVHIKILQHQQMALYSYWDILGYNTLSPGWHAVAFHSKIPGIGIYLYKYIAIWDGGGEWCHNLI